MAVQFRSDRDAHIDLAICRKEQISIADFPMGGRARIGGRVSYAGPPITAPLSGRPCAFYELLIEEAGRRDNIWRTVLRETEGTDFVVQDRSGKALVRAQGSRIAVVKDHHRFSGVFNRPSPEMQALFDRHGIDTNYLAFDRKLRFREGVLEAGEEAGVVGWGQCEPDDDARPTTNAYRNFATQLVMVSTPGQPVTVSDHQAVDSSSYLQYVAVLIGKMAKRLRRRL